MTITHTLGFPRIGAQRELKRALENYWKGQCSQDELEAMGRELRARHWKQQAQAGLSCVTVGDFAWYDHILEWSTLLGVVPARFGQPVDQAVSLDTLFRMARGRAPSGTPAPACEMTKWFDTNYHYIVPELAPHQTFRVARTALFEQVDEALALGHNVKVSIPGPLSWLWLGKGDAYATADDAAKLALLDELVPVYEEVLTRLRKQGVEWVQVDEPILALDLTLPWKDAYGRVYDRLAHVGPQLLMATYFDAVNDKLDLISALPVHGWHIDLDRSPQQLDQVVNALRHDQVLSAGVISGRNVWRTDLDAALTLLADAKNRLGDRLWLAPSCSLLHVPVDLDLEADLDEELRAWLSFALQKLDELRWLADALSGKPSAETEQALNHQREALRRRKQSPRIHNVLVQQRVREADAIQRQRTPFSQRQASQHERLKLPLFPTTTIGSFPQTDELRRIRREWRQGTASDTAYDKAVQAEIERTIRFQEEVGLDVLVHGEPERNDMVEYFGELLSGFAFTRHGWVQSYGSRCVKPPLIFGDVLRPAPMTVGWTAYAQSLTSRPVKGMLTGPVTLLQWSFVRDDQPRELTCRQLALALRDEVLDLEAAGIAAIQIDEPAIREGLPLRRAEWTQYLNWAVDSFLLATSGVQDSTQIHTHMCYSEFNDIIESIAAMDADVITIETSRSNMALLQAFEDFEYPNHIGPGVYDIHSPNIPNVQWMVDLIEKAALRLPRERLWINPDCGLKTRSWSETEPALFAMVEAAHLLRARAVQAEAVA